MTYSTLVETRSTKAERQRMERKLNPSEATWRRMLERAQAEQQNRKPKMAPGIADAMRAFQMAGQG